MASYLAPTFGNFIDKIPKIACIHEDLANYQVSKAIFSQHQQKIAVVFLNNAQNVLSQLFKIKPDLIFCELLLLLSPLDGYDFWTMLCHSTSVFRRAPIVVISNQDLLCNGSKPEYLELQII